jgi:hypothetical protein
LCDAFKSLNRHTSGRVVGAFPQYLKARIRGGWKLYTRKCQQEITAVQGPVHDILVAVSWALNRDDSNLDVK